MFHRKNSVKAEYLKELEAHDSSLFDTLNNIVFNFKFFISGKDYGQSFDDWQKDGILSELNNKLKDFSGKTISDLFTDRTLEIYSNYQHDSGFKIPYVLKSIDIEWAGLSLTGRRRVIGFLLKEAICDIKATENGRNIFYMVFLDKEHDFAPYRKK